MNEKDVTLPVLSAELIRPFVEDAGRYLVELRERQDELDKSSSPVRDEMLRLEFILPSRDTEGDVLPLHAVDSSSHDVTLGTLSTCVGLAVCMRDIERPILAQIRKTGPNTEEFRHLSAGLRLQLELRLLSQSESLTIADLSNWSLLMDANKVITAHSNLGDGSPHFIDMVEECFNSSGSRTLVRTLLNPNVIAMSKTSSSAAICQRDSYKDLLGRHQISDRVLMGKVLRPGERTREIPLKEFGSMGLAGGKVNIERREIDEDDRRSIEAAFKERLFVAFYRPWPFHGAFRIEFHRKRFPDGKALADLFATVQHATRFPTILEPIPQYLADQFCRSIHEVAESLYGDINLFRFPDVLKYTRSSDMI